MATHENEFESSREPNDPSNPYNKKENKINMYANPLYNSFYDSWWQLYVTVELGSKGVKDENIAYLPKTEGMEKDKDDKRYSAYLKRALYRNFCESTIKKAKGLMHSKPTTFKLNNQKPLEYLITKASVSGESLDSLLKNINDHQLLMGRIGLLSDFPLDGSREPKIALYGAFSIVDWVEEMDSSGNSFLRFVKLDESGEVYNFETNKYEKKSKFRLLALGERYNKNVYYSKVFDSANLEDWNIKKPKWSEVTVFKMGGKTIDYIPFTVANIKKTGMRPEKPLLIEQSNHAITCFQNDADYRSLIRLQAFALLTGTGVSQKEIDEKGGVQADGYFFTEDAKARIKYESAGGDGLFEMRANIEMLKAEASDSGIVINDKLGVESGKALSTRISLKTADLKDIAITGAEALQDNLGFIAKWLNTEPPVVEPNLDFNQETEEPRSFNEMVTANQSDSLGWENLYKYGKANNLIHEPTFEEWDLNRKTGLV